MLRRALPALIALSLALAAAGCGGPVSEVSDDPRVFVYEDGYHDDFFVPDTTTGMSLDYDTGDGCLYLRGGPTAWVPLWPEGTEGIVVDGQRGVSFPGFTEVLAGSRITVYGAGWASPHDSISEPEVLDECPGADRVLVVVDIGHATTGPLR